jgi:hypothetical protein
MSNCDPPKHTRIRRLNLRSFSARRIAGLEPKVRAKAAELINGLLRHDEFDLVAGLTFPLPAYMIFTLIGFPPEDLEMLKSWCANRTLFSWGRPCWPRRRPTWSWWRASSCPSRRTSPSGAAGRPSIGLNPPLTGETTTIGPLDPPAAGMANVEPCRTRAEPTDGPPGKTVIT